MQDVVTLAFPLTWLCGASKYAPHGADTDSNNIVDSMESSTNDASANQPADNGTSIPAIMSSTVGAATTIPNVTTAPTSNITSASPSNHHVINSPTPKKDVKFERGTATIPDEMQTIRDQVRACKHHPSTNMQVRLQVRNRIPEHFNAAGTMRVSSSLLAWYGDRDCSAGRSGCISRARVLMVGVRFELHSGSAFMGRRSWKRGWNGELDVFAAIFSRYHLNAGIAV
jgi:hypothetical protein